MNAEKPEAKTPWGAIALGGFYLLLVAGSIVGIVVYLVREEAAMAAVYILLSALLIGLGLLPVLNDKPKRRPPPPPVLDGRRTLPPGSGNQGRRWP